LKLNLVLTINKTSLGGFIIIAFDSNSQGAVIL